MSEYLKKTARIHHELCQPDFLNQLVSSKQVEFLMQVVNHSYFGRIHINPTVWANKLDSSYDTIKKYIRIFCDMEVLDHIGNHEYIFNYYYDNRKDNPKERKGHYY